MSVTRNYARHLRVITVLQTITLQLRIVTRKVRNYGVITHFTHLQRNAGSVTRNSHTLPQRIYGGAMRCHMAPFAGPAASGMSASRLLDMPFSRGSPY